jgi:predicted nucleotidyltransferase
VLNRDFKEFIQSLNDNHVRYLIVGGYAVAFHGHPRYTKDIDGIQVSFIDLENLRRNKQASGRYQDLADLESLK